MCSAHRGGTIVQSDSTVSSTRSAHGKLDAEFLDDAGGELALPDQLHECAQWRPNVPLWHDARRSQLWKDTKLALRHPVWDAGRTARCRIYGEGSLKCAGFTGGLVYGMCFSPSQVL